MNEEEYKKAKAEREKRYLKKVSQLEAEHNEEEAYFEKRYLASLEAKRYNTKQKAEREHEIYIEEEQQLQDERNYAKTEEARISNAYNEGKARERRMREANPDITPEQVRLAQLYTTEYVREVNKIAQQENEKQMDKFNRKSAKFSILDDMGY